MDLIILLFGRCYVGLIHVLRPPRAYGPLANTVESFSECLFLGKGKAGRIACFATIPCLDYPALQIDAFL